MKIIFKHEEIIENYAEILRDESQLQGGIPQIVCLPRSEAEVKESIDEAIKRGLKITLAGGRTGTTGGAVPYEEGGCLISFSEMNRIKSIEWDEEKKRAILRCDPGVTLKSVRDFLESPYSFKEVKGREKLFPASFFYPPDPTELTAQLGGTVATNASGARSFKFGPTRLYIAYLRVILSSGEILYLKRASSEKKEWDRTFTTQEGTVIRIPNLPYESPTLKNSAGYYNKKEMEAIDLFIGSEGTLGAITEVGIYLIPVTSFFSGLTFFNSTEEAFEFADFLRLEPSVAAIEFFDKNSLLFMKEHEDRIPGRKLIIPNYAGAAILWDYIESEEKPFTSIVDQWEEKLKDCNSSLEMTVSGFDKNEKEALATFRHALPEIVNSIIAQNKRSYNPIRKIGTDTAFDKDKFKEAYNKMINILDDSKLKYVVFGHLGDYHPHINIIPYSEAEFKRALDIYDELMSITISYNGTVSAEHGIGKIKKKYFHKMYGEKNIKAMKMVKEALDPLWIFNPGNLF
ncbi:MAG: FAD-binding oxidoreductase [Chitinispirillaceae bacterium]|nr:FAD-binding oxidoreductase [Chitinispirillaceae bacterium]